MELEKAEFIATYKANNLEDQERIKKEIEELSEKLLSATRVESRWINQKLQELYREQNKHDVEI